MTEDRARTTMLNQKRATQTWCSICGRHNLELHGHELRSAAQGGSRTDPDNVVLACDYCNGRVEDEHAEAARRGWKICRCHEGPPDGARTPWPVPWQTAA